ncbi:MAG: hypothetical protein D6E12_00565 [Desulfovibrio sp.]|nr:MAG: hypothetical protein D6E12_00565 [Desulfovibrio sp.]
MTLTLLVIAALAAPLMGCNGRPTMFYNYYCFDCADPGENANAQPTVTHYRRADNEDWGFEAGYTPGYVK